MNDVIEFYYDITRDLWGLILSNWILSASVLISVIGYIVTLVNTSRGGNK